MILPTTPPPVQTLSAISPLLTSLTPLLTHRITTPAPPPSLSPSTITYLTALSDESLTRIHTKGPIHYLTTCPTAPAHLRNLATQATALSATFPLLPSAHPYKPSRRRSRARPHASKRNQIAALTKLLSHILSALPEHSPHILDIGAGHAHLAAHLAAHLDLNITALDNNPDLIRAARTLHNHPRLTLRHQHLTPSTPTPITSQSILLGLHACGALSDSLVTLSARHKPAAALLVSCCLQKIPTPHRPPLSRVVSENNALNTFFTLPRPVLGATNPPHATQSPQNLHSRVTRHALRTLLAEHKDIQYGDEVRNISRHALKNGLYHLAPRVLAEHGINTTISEQDANRRMRRAERDYRLMRALSVPRLLAGHVLEMAVVLDRAAALQEAGYSNVLTCRVWPSEVSPRNLCCAAW